MMQSSSACSLVLDEPCSHVPSSCIPIQSVQDVLYFCISLAANILVYCLIHWVLVCWTSIFTTIMIFQVLFSVVYHSSHVFILVRYLYCSGIHVFRNLLYCSAFSSVQETKYTMFFIISIFTIVSLLSFYQILQLHFCISMFVLAAMNHTAASGTTSSPELPLSTSVVSNSRQPTSSETVPLADRSTIYRSHDYEELPASRFLFQIFCLISRLMA